MRFDFKLIPQADLEERLRYVFDSIGKTYEKEAISAIARAGAGSVRDMLSIADTCVSYTDGTLTYDDVTAVLGGIDFSAVAAWCEAHDVPYILKRTRLAEAAIAQSAGKPPCSLCAKMRRGVLHRTAVEAGCNVVALGHHKDDAAETVLMNLLEGSRFACFAPVTDLDRRGLRLIRPLLFMTERDSAHFAAAEESPFVHSRWPVDGHTHRQKAKDLVASLSAEYGDVAEKLTHALTADHINRW